MLGTQREPQLRWQIEGMGRGYSSIAVAGGSLYTTGNLRSRQSVVAVDAATGNIRWTTPFAKTPKHSAKGARCTPTLDGDRLYVISSGGSIACVGRADGALRWRRDFRDRWDGRMMSRWGFSESPAVEGDRVVCTPGGPDAMVVALDKLTGDELWRCPAPDETSRGRDGAGYSSIVVSQAAGVKQYVQLVGRGVVGIRAEDGRLLWHYNRVANGTANVAGDLVFCSSGYGTGSALLQIVQHGDSVTAREKYFLNARTLQNHHGGMVLAGDYVYCGHGHNKGLPICVELKSGQVAWGGDNRGVGKGSAAVSYVDGHLIFRYQSGEIAIIEASPDEYRLKGAFRPAYQKGKSWSHPVVSEGRLYLREHNVLMCYDISPRDS